MHEGRLNPVQSQKYALNTKSPQNPSQKWLGFCFLAGVEPIVLCSGSIKKN